MDILIINLPMYNLHRLLAHAVISMNPLLLYMFRDFVDMKDHDADRPYAAGECPRLAMPLYWGYICNACSQEVFSSPASGCRNVTLVLRNGREDGEFGVEVFAQVHDGGDITAAVAIIGRAPDRDDRLVFEMPLRQVNKKLRDGK